MSVWDQVTDHVDSKCAAGYEMQSVIDEAIEAKKELIIKTISEGGEVEGNDLETVLESVLPEDVTVKSLCNLFKNGTTKPFIEIVQSEIERVADELAVKLVNEEMNDE